MNTEPAIKTNHLLTQRQAIFCIACAISGYFVNNFSVEVFVGSQFVFGGVFVLLVSVLYGPWLGATTAVIAFLPTLSVLGDPVALITATSEALVVGNLSRRANGKLIKSVSFYWLVIGLPGVSLYYFQLAPTPFPNNWATVIKFVVNDLAVILLVKPFFDSRSLLNWAGGTQPMGVEADNLSQKLRSKFIYISVWPFAVLTFFVGQRFNDRQISAFDRELGDHADSIHRIVSTFSVYWRLHVEYAAQDLNTGADTPEFRQELLDRYRRRDFEISSFFVADEKGIVITASGGTTRVGDSVANFDFFQRPKPNGSAMSSPTFSGSYFGDEMTQAVSAAYSTASGSRRVIVARMSLHALSNYINQRGNLRNREYFVVDDKFQHVLTNSKKQESFELEKITSIKVKSSKIITDDILDKETGQKSRYHGIVRPPTAEGPLVYVRAELWPAAREIAIVYAAAFVFATIVISVSILVARSTALSLSRPFTQLVAFTRSLSERSTYGALKLDNSTVKEWRELATDLSQAAQKLANSNEQLEIAGAQRERALDALKTLSAELESRVGERTAELNDARLAAERASQAKSEFLATVSHELRTPLNVAMGHIFMLLQNPQEPLSLKQINRVERIRTSATQLLQLINEILDLAKLDSGSQSIEFSNVAIKSLCEDSIAFFQEEFIRANLNLRVNIPDDIGHVAGDANRIKQILINLIGNAIKFTGSGGTVGIELSRESNGAQIVLSVWDTGIGMNEEQLSRLFRPFEQLDSGRSRKYGGTGLGLAIVKRLTDLHGYRLTVASTPDQGSRFSIIMPSYCSTKKSPA